jgi:predicted  nucleic acid-binding Zn-ribbon protein
MAPRDVKKTETTEEKPKGSTTESKATTADSGDKGQNESAPVAVAVTGEQAAQLRAENERLNGEVADLHGEIDRLNELVRSTKADADALVSQPNPLEKDLEVAKGRIDELEGQLQELLDAAAPEDLEARDAVEGGSRQARGILLGIVLAMPENYRLNGIGDKLDELEALIAGFEGNDRYIAIELVRSIAEVRPADILSGRYINDVNRAFAILDGESEDSITATDVRDEQAAAYHRLSSVVGSNVAPDPEQPRAREGQPDVIADGSAAQNAAAARLYTAAG